MSDHIILLVPWSPKNSKETPEEREKTSWPKIPTKSYAI